MTERFEEHTCGNRCARDFIYLTKTLRTHVSHSVCTQNSSPENTQTFTHLAPGLA